MGTCLENVTYYSWNDADYAWKHNYVTTLLHKSFFNVKGLKNGHFVISHSIANQCNYKLWCKANYIQIFNYCPNRFLILTKNTKDVVQLFNSILMCLPFLVLEFIHLMHDIKRYPKIANVPTSSASFTYNKVDLQQYYSILLSIRTNNDLVIWRINDTGNLTTKEMLSGKTHIQTLFINMLYTSTS